jgi:hypothetical protein
MIEMNKKYKTRDGQEVRILMVNGGGEYPVIGARKDGEFWEEASWSMEGNFYTNEEDGRDLLEVQEEVTGWVNIYPADNRKDQPGVGLEYTFKASREQANKDAASGRVACIQITYTKGQGL